jgi:uncharacterized membrane protein YccC
MTPERARYGAAIDLKQRLRQAARTLAGMDALYADLADPDLCARLGALVAELATVEQRLGEVAEGSRPVSGEMRAVTATPPPGGPSS